MAKLRLTTKLAFIAICDFMHITEDLPIILTEQHFKKMLCQFTCLTSRLQDHLSSQFHISKVFARKKSVQKSWLLVNMKRIVMKGIIIGYLLHQLFYLSVKIVSSNMDIFSKIQRKNSRSKCVEPCLEQNFLCNRRSSLWLYNIYRKRSIS